MDKLNFNEWLEQLAVALGKILQCDGHEYIYQTGKECWKEAYIDGLSPQYVAEEEAYCT